MGSNLKIVFIIGSQKSGTTWLRENLISQELFNNCPIKEIHYYSQYIDFLSLKNDWMENHRLDQYQNSNIQLNEKIDTLIKSKAKLGLNEYIDISFPDQNKVGIDASTEYCMLEEKHFKLMLNDFPNAKFIMLLRDPLQRALSQVLMQEIAFYDEEHIDNSENVTHILAQSRYSSLIPKLTSILGDKILFLDYKDILKNPRELLDTTLKFSNIYIYTSQVNYININKKILQNKNNFKISEKIKEILGQKLEKDIIFYNNFFKPI
jgi:NADPH-dependent 7-cyano-7-deazaguanine reductase QueF-like protein